MSSVDSLRFEVVVISLASGSNWALGVKVTDIRVVQGRNDSAISGMLKIILSYMTGLDVTVRSDHGFSY